MLAQVETSTEASDSDGLGVYCVDGQYLQI